MHGDFFVCHGFALQHDHASRQSTSDAILSQFPKCRPDVISLRLFSTSEIMGHVNRVATCNCFLLLFHEEFLSTFGEAYTYRTGLAGSCAGSVCCVTPPQSFCTKYVRRSDPARDQFTNCLHQCTVLYSFRNSPQDYVIGTCYLLSLLLKVSLCHIWGGLCNLPQSSRQPVYLLPEPSNGGFPAIAWRITDACSRRKPCHFSRQFLVRGTELLQVALRSWIKTIIKTEVPRGFYN